MQPDIQPMTRTGHSAAFDSGILTFSVGSTTEEDGSTVIYRGSFSVEGARGGIRLQFDPDATQLPGTVGTDASYIILTSRASGHHQKLNGMAMQQWYHTSASLDGPAFDVAIHAYPTNTTPIRVKITGAFNMA
eukprot:TRINITY_DN3788_c0_g1_i1.p1 TRINITY_DN3788_c0_g1~~TRINITY_DN3788_c0_g1_i1.p1  ORF type:complete len:133 (-),score=21.97 TRINITY_DN3788_c0_g1_i1:22-420(-)